nr:multidrug resistance-associated protein 1-like [Lepeophtheirus salmonis]
MKKKKELDLVNHRYSFINKVHMKFCKDNFWDLSQIWDTNYPYFSDCFFQTIISLSPSMILFLLSPLELLYNKNKCSSPKTLFDPFSIFKAAIPCILIVLSILEGIFIQDFDTLSDFLKIFLMITSFGFSLFLHVDGVIRRCSKTSTLQFFFYFLLLISSCLSIRRIESHPEDLGRDYLWLICLQTGCVLVATVLYSISETVLKQKSKKTKENPKKDASFFSLLFYEWITPLLWKGFKKPITEDDLWNLNKDLTCGETSRRLDQYYFKSGNKKIGIPLMKAFGFEFVIGSTIKFFSDILSMVLPQIMKLMINHADSEFEMKERSWKGYLYPSMLIIVSFLQSVLLAKYFEIVFLVSMRIRASLTSLVYRKCLKLSNSSRKNKSVGEIVNIMSVDVSRIADLMPFLTLLWSSPFQIVVSVIFMYNELGWAIIGGTGILLITIPVNAILSYFGKKFQMKQMKAKDNRTKILNEVLGGIRILKLYAWEPSYINKIEGIRGVEIGILKKAAWLTSFMGFIWSSTPFIVALASFATFVMVDDRNILTAEKAFVTQSYINKMKIPMAAFPFVIVAAISATVSLKRINQLLTSDELQKDAVERVPMKINQKIDQGDAIVIRDGNFKWSTEDSENTLSNINLRIKHGSLTAIVGTVGSGKSSLISAILGEMVKKSGKVRIKGQIAYVPQESWMQNTSLKNNILFGKPYDEEWYNQVLEYCCLTYDLSLLPAGDETEIGERGINLSGGQRQRISLARAIYSDADVYIFDNPLSALDSQVGKSVFNNVLNNNTGIIKDKTRLLVTHGISYLPHVHHIAVMLKGEIIHEGTYQELLEKKIIQTIEEEEEQEKDGVQENNINNYNNIPKTFDATVNNLEKAAIIQKEGLETGRVSWSVYKYYIQSIGFLGAFLIIFNQMLNQLFGFGSSIWLEAWTQEDYGNATIPKYRDLYLGVYGALGIGQAVTIFLLSLSVAMFTLKASKVIHNQTYDRIMRAPISFFDSTPQGRILNRFSKDISICDNILGSNIRQWLACLFSFLGIVILIVSVLPLFLLFALPTSLVFILIQNIYVASSRQLKRLQSVTRSPIYSHFSESLNGLSSIRAYGVQSKFILESINKIDTNQRCNYPSIIANRWLAMRLETIGNLCIFGAAILTMTNPELVGPGKVGLVISYALILTQNLNWLVRQTSEIETNIVAVERLKEYAGLDIEKEWRLHKDTSYNWPSQGKVEFKNYSLRYKANSDLVLKKINFTIFGGERVGIVGRTGAGKSSLSVALFRIVEAANGQILIDGKDISTLGLHDLRESLTVIPQEPLLFSGTLRSNLDPENAFSDHDIWNTLGSVHLKEYIRDLKDGLNHSISEGGLNLSSGQRQLMCLARALLRSCKILILDEATAAVDWETDEKIQETIRCYFPSCTILTIAHRLKTIIDYDKILVLDKGTVIEFGSPNELYMNSDSVFHSMINAAGITLTASPKNEIESTSL